MPKPLLAALIFIVIAGIGAYVYFQGKEYEVRITQAELQEKLAARMPLRRTYLFIFEVVLDEPRLQLLEGSDRVNAGLDVTLNIRLNDEPLPVGGGLDVSGGVRYEPSQGQFFLTEPAIENLNVQGIPAKYTDKVHRVLTKAVGEYYADRPIYTLDSSAATTAVARLLLKSVVVEDQVLIVTLGI